MNDYNDSSDKDTAYKEIQVVCYSGYKANEHPVAFSYQDRYWEISEILDRWYEGGLNPVRWEINYFKVRTPGVQVFILRYSSLLDSWSVRVRN